MAPNVIASANHFMRCCITFHPSLTENLPPQPAQPDLVLSSLKKVISLTANFLRILETNSGWRTRGNAHANEISQLEVAGARLYLSIAGSLRRNQVKTTIRAEKSGRNS